MLRLCVIVMPALMFFDAAAFAQARGVELQGGAGYVRDSGEGPSVPAVNAGVVAWITRGWGIGARLTEGLTDDHYDPPRDGGDRLFYGPGDLRMWTVTSQWRAIARGTEVNIGVGVGGHGYRYTEILTGIRRGDEDEERIDPIPPQLIRMRSGSGFIAFDLLVGRRLAGPVHVKAGFTYGLRATSIRVTHCSSSRGNRSCVMVSHSPTARAPSVGRYALRSSSVWMSRTGCGISRCIRGGLARRRRAAFGRSRIAMPGLPITL
jgi:hypothetical protein